MKTVSERLRRNANMCARVNAAVALLCETAFVGANEIERLEKQRDELLTALKEARMFIRNGIDLGFIRMPDADTPDPAHDTLPHIDDAIAKAEKSR